MRLRQLALAARELEPVVEDLCEVFGIEVGFRDPGVGTFGLHNAVMPVGDTFLEVVSPVEAGTSAGRWLDRHGGDGGYMVIVQSEDLDKDRRRMEELGVRIVWEHTLEDIATIHLHPRDVGGAILSLDVPRPPESWRWAGPEWRSHVRGGVTTALVGAELEAPDPEALAARWSQLLARPALPLGSGAHQIELEGSHLRFVPQTSGHGAGLGAIELAAADAPRALATARSRGLETGDGEVTIGGTVFRLR
jgi:hypothetical protein